MTDAVQRKPCVSKAEKEKMKDTASDAFDAVHVFHRAANHKSMDASHVWECDVYFHAS